MVIFGTRGVTYRHKAGAFYCPNCGPEQDFKHKRVRRFFTLYFIPVLPLDLLGEYVECARCRGTYHKDVLTFDPSAADAEFEAEFHGAIRRVMIKMMMADGVIDDEEITTITAIYAKLADKQLTETAIRDEAVELEGDDQSLKDYVASVRGNLNDNGKELVIRAALSVAAADGEIADEERLLLLEIGEAMEMSKAHVMGVLQVAAEA